MLRARVTLLLATVGLFGVAGASAASAEPSPRGGVSRVTADFIAESWLPRPTFVGVAHIQVHAWDTDQAPFSDEVTGDVGWTSCDPVGSPQCVNFPNGGERTNIRWLVIFRNADGSEEADISPGFGRYMSLRDGGAPGNDPVSDGFLTRDAFADWSLFSGFIAQSGPLLGGNITIQLQE